MIFMIPISKKNSGVGCHGL